MAMLDDPGKALRQLEKELKAAQPQEEAPLGEEDFYFPGEAHSEEAYYEDDYRRDWKARRRERRKARRAGGFGILAALELLAIVALIGWWILWLTGR